MVQVPTWFKTRSLFPSSGLLRSWAWEGFSFWRLELSHWTPFGLGVPFHHPKVLSLLTSVFTLTCFIVLNCFSSLLTRISCFLHPCFLSRMVVGTEECRRHQRAYAEWTESSLEFSNPLQGVRESRIPWFHLGNLDSVDLESSTGGSWFTAGVRTTELDVPWVFANFRASIGSN